MSKSLPIEVEICNVVKEIMAKHGLKYIKKYCHNQIRDGVKTGKRNHKFWGIRSNQLKSKFISWGDLYPIIEEMNTIVQYIDSSYSVKLHGYTNGYCGTTTSIKIKSN